MNKRSVFLFALSAVLIVVIFFFVQQKNVQVVTVSETQPTQIETLQNENNALKEELAKKSQKSDEIIEAVTYIKEIEEKRTQELNEAEIKSADAGVKLNLASARAQAELFFDSDRSYESLCAAKSNYGIHAMVRNAASYADATFAANDATASSVSPRVATCHDTPSAWAASVPLKSSGFYCVDSTGNSKATISPLSSNLMVCPDR